MGVLALAVGLYAALALPRLSRTNLAAILGLGAIGLAMVWAGYLVAPPTGLKASYWAGSSATGQPERSTDFPWLTDASRIEPGLVVRGEDFGVHFFNDASRFNFGPDVTPGRDQLPFSVRWEGWLLVPSDGPRRFSLEANGPARAAIDTTPLPTDDTPVSLKAGLHTIAVEYTRPEAQVPALTLRWQRQPGDDLEPVGGEDVRWRQDEGSAMFGSVLAWLGSAIVGAAIVAWLVLGAARLTRSNAAAWWKAGLGLAPLLLLGYGMLLEAPTAGKATILSGLDDWLIYESSARDILLNGALMDGGQSHAAPFYGQPLYPYVLALLHRLSGESLFGPITLQFAALGLVVVGTGVLARRAFGTLVDGLAAVAFFAVLLQLEPEHFKIARQLFNENLYMPLVMASLTALVTLALRAEPTRWWTALLVGVLLGLTAISRSQFLLFVPLGLVIVWLAWRRAGPYAIAMTVLIALGVVLTIAPVTLRNWIVSGQFVPISSSGGASLLEFHRPPAGLIDQSALDHEPLYDALHLDQPTRTVVAFIRADPPGYLATLLPLGAHSIGLQGRNDPGVYWPLFLTVLVYAGSFALKRTRRLHVWPIHAFVATHLLVLMLFEADTYGYRLVMPMYAPMVLVAAQVPLEFVRAAMRSRAAAGVRSGQPARSGRFAVVGLGALIVLAVGWQAKGLVDTWPQREPALHGLGGAAANAALTSDAVNAATIYVASVDGTPRRFGAGNLPGLRYPWFKWFDPTRTLPLPSDGSTAVYMLSELVEHQPGSDLTPCLGAPDAAGEVVLNATQARAQCGVGKTASAVSFEGVARFDGVQVPAEGTAGDPLDARLVWQPLVAHPSDAYQVSLQLDDPSAADGIQWGNGTLDLYPSAEWQPSETLLSRVAIATDPTALPQSYRVTLGIGPQRANAQPALAVWQGSRTDRVPVGSVTLAPGSGAAAGAALSADLRPLEGPPLVGGGLELIGARALPSQAAVGSPLRVGLLWKAVQDKPTAAQVRLRLVGPSGEVVQESLLPVFGGRVAPSALHAGNVVRDEQTLVIDPGVPSEAVSLVVAMDDASLRLGSLTLTGRAHVFDTSGQAPVATFGDAMQVLSTSVEPENVKPGDKVTLKVRWRGSAATSTAYKVFVHVLDPDGTQVVAQRDAEPQDGKAPTTSWVANEVIDDEYQVALPAGVGAGSYPIELGVYDPKTGNRLTLADGSNRLLLDAKLTVTR